MTASSLPEKPRSLCRELTIALAALASVVSIIAILLNYAYFSLKAESLHESKTSEYAVYLQEALELPLSNADDGLIGKIASVFAVNDEVAALTIRDKQQRVIYHQEKSGVDLPRREITVKHNGQKIGSVEIGLSLKIYKESGRQALLAGMAALVLLSVVLLAATRWLLSGLLKKPIDGFIAATSNMVEGKYGQIELPVSYAEFAPILSGFKIMSDAVATRESSLQRINENLSAEIDVRKRVEAALRASEERWQFALEGAGDGVWDWDMQTDKTTFSKRWKEMLGYAEDEFEESFEAWKQSLHPDDLEHTLGGCPRIQTPSPADRIFPSNFDDSLENRHTFP